jgi:hypothetical protein
MDDLLQRVIPLFEFEYWAVIALGGAKNDTRSAN